jgi:hypothetical protein
MIDPHRKAGERDPEAAPEGDQRQDRRFNGVQHVLSVPSRDAIDFTHRMPSPG